MNPSYRRIRLASLLPPGGAVHPVRTRYRPGDHCSLHTHDFCEFSWIEQGTACHLRPSGEQHLEVGDCLAIPPGMVHGFSSSDQHGFTLANIAMPTELLAFARSRWAGPWPWGDAEDDARPLRLGPSALVRLGAWLDDLSLGAPLLDAEATALVILREVARRDDDRDRDLPPPLQRALADLACGDLPIDLAPPLLARACGWSVTHLNRVVRAARGCTTTALLDSLRLERAERLLRLDPRPVTAIALACGFPSLPHFYRRFAATRGCAPGAYRQRQRDIVLGTRQHR